VSTEEVVYILLDAGEIIGIHRTEEGALKARQKRIEQEIESFHQDVNLDNYNLSPEERKLAELFKLDETPAKLKESPEQFEQRVSTWYTVTTRTLLP
jgi:hypothetical protein